MCCSDQNETVMDVVKNNLSNLSILKTECASVMYNLGGHPLMFSVSDIRTDTFDFDIQLTLLSLK